MLPRKIRIKIGPVQPLSVCSEPWDTAMWALCSRTKLLDLNMSLLSTLTLPVCLYPLNHTMLPLLNGWKAKAGLMRELLEYLPSAQPQPIISIITMLLQILLHRFPEELNEVQLTVKLQEENTKMSRGLNGFLNKRFLFLEIRLQYWILMEEFDTSGMGSFFLLLFCLLGGRGHVVMRWYIIESNY